MQRLSAVRLLFAASSLVFALQALPSHAQVAYNNARRVKDATGHNDPVAGKPTATKPTYKIVHGVVQGQQGALPGATVWLHGSRTIAVTNSEGEFELRVPADAKVVKLTCGFGGLQDEVVTTAPVQALGSIYLLRPQTALGAAAGE